MARLVRITLSFTLGRQQREPFLLQQLQQATAACSQQAVTEQQRNRHTQPQHRGHQGLGNATRHQFGVAGSKQRDALEGADHAGNRAQQTQQGCDRSNQFQQGQSPLQHGSFLQQHLVDAQLGFIRGATGPTGCQYAPQRVAAVGLISRAQLDTNAELDLQCGNQFPQRHQQTDAAQNQNDVAHQSTLSNAGFQIRGLRQQSQQIAATGINQQGVTLACRKVTRLRNYSRARLHRQLLQNGVVMDQVSTVVGNGGKGSDPQNFGFDATAVRLHHWRTEAGYFTGCSHLLLQQKPEPFQFGQ